MSPIAKTIVLTENIKTIALNPFSPLSMSIPHSKTPALFTHFGTTGNPLPVNQTFLIGANPCSIPQLERLLVYQASFLHMAL